MKIINFIASAVALFAATTTQLVTAQHIVSRTGGVRGLSDERKEKMAKIMNTIANMHPEGSEEGNDIVERILSNDKTMESIAKLKDALRSVDMSEMINTVIEHNNKHGRKLEIDQGVMDDFIGWLEGSLGLEQGTLQLQAGPLVLALIALILIFGPVAVILFAFSNLIYGFRSILCYIKRVSNSARCYYSSKPSCRFRTSYHRF